MPPLISLLSSSPEPQASKPKAKATVEKPLAKASTAIKATFQKNAPRNDIYMISDEEQSLPSKKLVKGSSKPDSKAKSTFSLPQISSDDDPYTLPSPKSFESVKPTMTSNSAKRNRDFFYNSDDFDSTINLDASLNDIHEPVAKKPRSSASIPATTLPKASAYQGSVSADKTPMRAAASKRSYSNIESTKPIADVPTMKRSNTTGSSRALELDPLIFTSSPDPYMDAHKQRAKNKKGNSGTSRGFNLDPLPELSSDTDVPKSKTMSTSSKVRPKKALTAFEQYEADREKEKKMTAKKTGRAKKDADDSDEKIKKALAKEAEKEAKLQAKAGKLREKEEKVREKERAAAVAKVNTLRTDKKVSAPEMIVVLPTALGTKLADCIKIHLDQSNIEHTTWESQIPVIKFRRKINAVFNEELGQYEPVPRHIKEEKHIIYLMLAQEFVELVMNKDERHDIDIFVPKLRSQFEGCKIVIVMEGYNLFLRKNKTIQNRKYTQAVRGEVAPSASQAKKKELEFVDENLLEDALLRLQMNHGVLIHHTAVYTDTAEQLMVFTQNISLIPYKYNLLSPPFGSFLTSMTELRNSLMAPLSAWNQAKSKPGKTQQIHMSKCCKKWFVSQLLSRMVLLKSTLQCENLSLVCRKMALLTCRTAPRVQTKMEGLLIVGLDQLSAGECIRSSP